MSTPRTSVKMAALAPMPSASVMTTTNVNPGDLRSWRKANLRSFMSLSAQCLNRIDMRGSTRRKKTGEECGHTEQHAGRNKGKRIAWADFVQDLGKDAASSQ